MKKMLSLVLILSFIFTLTACGIKEESTVQNGENVITDQNDANKTTDQNDVNKVTDQNGDKKITVGVVQTRVNESDWRTANTKSFQTAFRKAGFTLKIAFGEGDHAKQISEAQQFIKEGVDYLVVLGVQAAGWEDVAKSAKNAGIPFIMADRRLDLPEDLYASSVWPDFEEEGEKAVDWLKSQSVKGAKIVIIGGSTGSPAQLGRSKAMIDGAEANGWKIVFNQNIEDWDEDLAYQAVAELIANKTKFNVIYAENDNMARGACRAMDAAEITYGKAGTVRVISFDANKWALEDVLAGKINIDIECTPDLAPSIVEIIGDLEAGKTVAKTVYPDEEMFDCSTITQADIDTREY